MHMHAIIPVQSVQDRQIKSMAYSKSAKLLLIIVGTVLLLITNQVSTSRVSILSNGYRDIVVGISPNVPQDQATTIIQNIQVK